MTELSYEHQLYVSTSVQASNGDNEGGAPVSLTEMAATGIPIVSSCHCDIPQVVIDGQTGWLAEERNVDSILEAIESAVSHHSSWPDVLSAGRNHVESHFDHLKQGTALAGMYRRQDFVAIWFCRPTSRRDEY